MLSHLRYNFIALVELIAATKQAKLSNLIPKALNVLKNDTNLIKMVRKYNYRYNNPFNLDDMGREKDSIHSVPFWIGLVLILFISGLYGLVHFVDGILPAALTINDEVDYPDAFIAERAINDLKYLTDLGPKVTGSYENEYVVVDFLTTQINSIISEAHESQYMESDVQIATGGYYLNDATGYMNMYDKIQNVVVKLHGQNNASEHSILINSHFDSVPISPGGMDDGINVAIMLEILRKLSKSETRQQQNVIFLFNGAEETALQASHAFIAHHKWAAESKIIVNLEASGSEGKLTLFQTGPQNPWLVKYYGQVPYPCGSVAAEEIFQSGVIPSDTDFRIFRDFGNMVGIDQAFYKNGYRYHTKYDGFSNIPNGSYQHGGANTLSVVKSFANAPEVLEKNSTGQTVFFDVFGLFLISYSTQTATIINYVTAALSLGVFLISLCTIRAGMTKTTFKFFLVTFLAIIFSWIIAALFVVGLAYLLDVLNKTLTWYGRPWLIFGLYLVPITALSGCLLSVTHHSNLSLGLRGQLQAHLLRLIWTILLVVGTFFNIRSSYIIMLYVLFNSVGFLIILIFRLQYTVRTWQIMHVTSLIIPITYQLYQFCSILHTLIPITGRLGSQVNPELYMALVCLLYAFMVVTPLAVLSNLLRRGIWYYLTLLAVFVTFFGLLYSPLGFPYSGDENAPKEQRHWLMHSQRQFYNESFSLIRSESGIMMDNMDRNSPRSLKPYLKELSNSASIEDDCDNYSFCALPLIHTKILKHIQYSTWIPLSDPVFPANETLKFQLVSKQQLSATQVKYQVQVSGPDKLTFYFTPKPNTTLVNLSLTDALKPSKYTFHDRPIYVMCYQLGKGDGSGPLTFSFTMETAEGHAGATIDLAVSARYVHEKRVEKTAAYLQFLGGFPEWAHAISWLSAYHSYVL